MNNLVLITSIINTPNIPLSYTNVRSVFSHEERFNQTKKTIETIRTKIPNVKIIMVECSDLTDEQNKYMISNVDYFINLINNQEEKQNIYSISKALGEGTMTMCAINYIISNNIEFDNFFKITGRYWLSDNFNYANFNNDNTVITNICDISTNTSLYKLHKTNIYDFYIFLISNINIMKRCVGYEVLFSSFIKTIKTESICVLNKIGVNGFISVSNDFVNV
jgi:hypothetical protein